MFTYGLSPNELEQVKAAQNRMDAYNQVNWAKTSELYKNANLKQMSAEERKAFREKVDDLSKEVAKDFPTFEEDKQLTRGNVRTMSTGRIWLFRGVK